MESVMPSALSVPICEPTSRSGACKGRTKREANDHRDPERDRNLHNGPSQVLQVLEKRLGSFALRQIAKFKNISQRHLDEGVNAARGTKDHAPPASRKCLAYWRREF